MVKVWALENGSKEEGARNAPEDSTRFAMENKGVTWVCSGSRRLGAGRVAKGVAIHARDAGVMQQPVQRGRCHQVVAERDQGPGGDPGATVI